MIEKKLNVPFAQSYWVVEGSFLAGEHPSETDPESTRRRLSALLDAGIQTFLDLTAEGELKSYRNSLRTLAEKRRLEISFVRIPIRDRSVPSVTTLRQVLDAIDQSLANEKSVYVHCFAGIGRTGTAVGCYLKRHGLAGSDDVIEKIAALRRSIPGDFGLSPHTPEQVWFVKNWEKDS